MWLTLCEQRLCMCSCGLVWPLAILSSTMRRACQASYWSQNVARNEIDLNPIFGVEWSPAALIQYQLNPFKTRWTTAGKEACKRKMMFVWKSLLYVVILKRMQLALSNRYWSRKTLDSSNFSKMLSPQTTIIFTCKIQISSKGRICNWNIIFLCLW